MKQHTPISTPRVPSTQGIHHDEYVQKRLVEQSFLEKDRTLYDKHLKLNEEIYGKKK
jgi:hypothetical protein